MIKLNGIKIQGNGDVYELTAGGGGGGGGADIDDSTTALDKTWSSNKIDAELSNKATINDEDMPSPSETWSSVKIYDELSSKATIDDTQASTASTWSSQKISDFVEEEMAGVEGENRVINYETQFDEDTETLTLLSGEEVVDISTADVKTNETYNGKEIYKRFRVFKNVTLPDTSIWKDNITDALPANSTIINSVINYNDNSANVFTLSTFAGSSNYVVAVVRPNGSNLVVQAGGTYLGKTADFYMTLYYIKG